MIEQVNGKVAFITGGNKGIGFGIAQVLLNAGMKVAISSQSQKSADEAAAALVAETGNKNVLPLQVDVRQLNEQLQALEHISAHFGGLDLLVANAGIGYFAPIDEMDVDMWNKVIDINLTGVFYSMKASIPSLKQTKGMIVTISSLAGTNFFPAGAAYNASKFGLTGFTQAAMLDLRKYGIRVSTIMPGSVTSHFNGHQPNEADAWKVQPEDIGKLVLDLMQMPARALPSKIEIRPSQPK